MALSFVSFSPERIAAVTAKLQELPEALVQIASTNGKRPTLEEHRILAEALFHRAPDDFIQRTSVETLAKIAHDTAAFYHRFSQGTEPFQIEITNSTLQNATRHQTSIFTAVTDRSFVVDSLTEYFRVRNIRHHVLIHPIIKDDQKTVSLAYIEIDLLEDQAQLATLKEELTQIFSDLLLVTDDFSTMTATVREAAGARTGDDHQGAELLSWLLDGNFIFLGCRASSAQGGAAQALGLFRTTNAPIHAELATAERDVQVLKESGRTFLSSQLALQSPIHRRARIDVFTVKVGSDKYLSLVGLLTSRASQQVCATIPVIRDSVQQILDREGLPTTSHDYKELVTYVNSLPKSFLFQVQTAELRSLLHTMIGIQRRSETRVSLHPDAIQRLLTTVVIFPRERYSKNVSEPIQKHLEEFFSLPPHSSTYQLALTDDLAVLTFTSPCPKTVSRSDQALELEKSFSALSETWRESFRNALVEKHGKAKAALLFERYQDVLPAEYQATTKPHQAVADLHHLEALTKEAPLALALHRSSRSEALNHLRLYNLGTTQALSALTPYIENSGFEIVSETLTELERGGEPFASIHDFVVRASTPLTEEGTGRVVHGLTGVFAGRCENDRLNALLTNSGLSVEQIAIVRTVCRYLWQIKAFPTEQSIVAALVENPLLAELLVEYFQVRFDPAFGAARSAERVKKVQEVESRFLAALKNVTLLAHDRVLRAAWNVIESTVRTNAYRAHSLRIALKINCQAILKLPRPRPYFEIFVCAPNFEGVHLRGGKVARGGLRWSERPDDFRTEVLGLMKTQMVKNSIIVPVGAKGGFVLKGEGSKAPAREVVVERYREFIRSLLEVTDNRVGQEIVPPVNVVSHDPLDPYLVVAADKGTADLSDVANEIATQEFKFWLGDAFASGGSYGYSHKKYGITARGAWETTLRHFRSLGKDVEKENFTVVGIGDMSGDVFGNGLILSRKALLLAAFDHRGIFLDPTPDAERSFIERQRLFDLPRSSWNDYTKELISQGGGVFPRDAKEIVIGKEASAALDLPEGTYSGQEVIRAILKAPVDLIWNGGIGTYVKASTEENINVSDRANDEVRVDATEVRAKIVGEGGNLGVTQLARIEYALRGGHIYTDAVDNSGGVNLSDLEVNLKILFSEALRSGELSFEKRNEILLQYVDDVCERVLVRNRAQSLVIDLDLDRSRTKLGMYQQLIATLERDGLLDRSGENLPNDETLARRAVTRTGLTRPELAVLTSYAKMFVFQAVLSSSLADDPFLTQYLVRYFPQGISTTYERHVLSHPLRREIIATQVANLLVERMGASFVHRLMSETSSSAEAVIRAFVTADSVLEGSALAARLEQYDRAGKQPEFRTALIKLASALDRMTRWFLEHQEEGASMATLAERYSAPLSTLIRDTADILPAGELAGYHRSITSLQEAGFSEADAKTLTLAQLAGAYLDVAHIANTTHRPLMEAARLFAGLSSELQISELLRLAQRIDSIDPWDLSALRSLKSEIRSGVGRLLRSLLKEKGDGDAALTQYRTNRSGALERLKTDVKRLEDTPVSVAALFVLSRQLEGLCRPPFAS